MFDVNAYISANSFFPFETVRLSSSHTSIVIDYHMLLWLTINHMLLWLTHNTKVLFAFHWTVQLFHYCPGFSWDRVSISREAGREHSQESWPKIARDILYYRTSCSEGVAQEGPIAAQEWTGHESLGGEQWYCASLWVFLGVGLIPSFLSFSLSFFLSLSLV